MKKCFIVLVLAALLAGCAPAHPLTITTTTLTTTTAMAAPTPEPTATPTPEPTPTPTPEPTPTPDPWAEYFSDQEVVKVEKGESWVYTSSTLSVFIRQHFEEDCGSLFFTAHIYSRDPKNFSTILWNEETGRDVTQPVNIARKYQAVFAQNGDFFYDSWNVDLGPDIRNGIAFKSTLGPDCMAMLNNGALFMFKNGRDAYSLEEFQSLGIQNTVAFGPILVENGLACDNLQSHSLYKNNPRSALGMVEPGHYVSILVDGRKPGISKGCTLDRLAEEMIKEGCVNAYNLDGGQSTAMVFLGEQLNSHEQETTAGQRRIPDMLAFGRSDLVKPLS